MGKRGRPEGYKLSQETKDKIAESKLGTEHSQETKDKISESLKEYFKHHSSWSAELKHRYRDDPELLKWVEEHSDLLDDFDDCTTDRRINRNSLRCHPVGNRVNFIPDVRNPELLLIDKQENRLE